MIVMLNNLKCFGRLSNFEISELEQRLDLKFPSDYKEFLSLSNGGHVENEYMVIQAPSLTDELVINFFLSKNEDKNVDLVSWNHDFDDELPASTYIFAVEYGGGMFIHILEGTDRGIYFWDSNFGLPETSDEENVFFLANTFSDFLAMIKVEKE